MFLKFFTYLHYITFSCLQVSVGIPPIIPKYDILFCEQKYYDNHHETVDIIEEVDLICEGASKGVVDPSWTIGVVDVVALSSGFKR